MRRPFLPLLAFCAALWWSWSRLTPLPEPHLDSAISAPRLQVEVALKAQLLPRAGNSAHAATLALRGDGKLVAAWFSGSREGAADVAIYATEFDGNAWSTPRRVVDHERVTRDTQRLVRKLGNPVLWDDANGVLHLWFVSVSYGGWAGSAINHMQSSDNGAHWSRVERLVTSPFWNLSTLVRNPPLALANGGVGLPVYHEFLSKRPEWLRFDARMRVVDKARMPGGETSLQPAAVALDAQRILAFMRDASDRHRVRVSTSRDAGENWDAVTPIPLANPNSGIALLRLTDGSLLLACNPGESDRNVLALLHSRDGGKRWSPPWVLEQGNVNDEFSYPALLQDTDGTVHLVYTWKRQAIKHVQLPLDRVEALQ